MTDDLHDLDTLAAEATPGPWKPHSFSYDDVDELADAFASSLRNTPEGTTGWIVWVPVDREVYVATTGNGPKSETHAKFFAAANPTRIRALIAEVRALRAKDNARHLHDGELAR